MNQPRDSFCDLGMPALDEFRSVESDTHGRQTATVMTALEDVCSPRKPDGIVVVGDVNSALACALVAAKRGIAVAHVETGLSSLSRSMPEEVNRVVTDQVSDLQLTTCEEAEEQLAREDVDRRKVRFLGNPMIDSPLRGLEAAGSEPAELGSRAAGTGLRYVVATLHRPVNVDAPEALAPIVEGLEQPVREAVDFFPVHPQTAARLEQSGRPLRPPPGEGDAALSSGVYALPPMPYLEFVRLLRGAAIVLTDSGGIHEGTTVMGVPCATLRPNTERPVTVRLGTNEVVERTPEAICEAAERALAGRWKAGTIPPLWDGKAAGRIADALSEPGWVEEARARRT